MKVALINPPTGKYRRDERCQAASDDQTAQVYFPPNDLIIMAGVFEAAGHQVLVIDAPGHDLTEADLAARLIDFAPELVVVSTTLPTMEADLAITGRIDWPRPPVVIAKGGPFYVAAGQALETYPILDGVIRHEYDFVCRDLAQGLDWAEIPGFSFRRVGELVHNPERSCTEDLDQIPIPARGHLDNSIYRNPENGRPIAVIQIGRGCNGHCVFCPAGVLTGYRLRFRSPEHILSEIRDCVETYGIREFLFNADTFTHDEDWVVELCQGIIEAGWNIRWAANSRVTTVSPKRFEYMKRAGCWVVAFGVESGDPTILKKIKKGISVGQIKKAIAMCQAAGLKAHTFYCIGTPWETEQSLEATYRLAVELKADFVDINVAYPLPGTELWELGQRDNLFNAPALSGASYVSSTIRSHELSAEQLAAWRRKALLKLQLRPSYLLKTALPMLADPRRLSRYIYYGGRRFWRLLSKSS